MRGLIANLLLVSALLTTGATGTSSSCDGFSYWTHCEATTDGSQVDVGAETTRPGGTPTNPRPGAGSSNGSNTTDPGNAGGEASVDENCVSELCRPTYTVETLPTVTAADLVSFRPTAASMTGEPAGLGVVGMPTNLIAGASTQHLRGPLLGYDVTVRFRPVGFRFDHGDGSTRIAPTGGTRWARLGLPDYSPTATSHVFRDAGTYRVAVAVVYEASVDFGTGSWRPVIGAVSSSATGYDVRIVEVRTALVERTCLEDPRGPGC